MTIYEKMIISYNLEHRNVVMGMSMVWIFLFHVPIYCEILLPLTSKGYAGVDLFVFLSGLGCYYSLTSNPDPYEFMKRRVLRIVPTYWIFVLLFYFPLLYSRLHFPEDYISILFFVLIDCNNECQLHNGPRPNRVNWYVGGMWIFYFILPIMVSFVQLYITNFYRLVCGIAFLTILCVPFSVDFLEASTFLRMPSLFAGVYFGKCSKEYSTITPSRWVPLVLLVFVAFYFLFTNNTRAHSLVPPSALPAGACIFIMHAAKYIHNWTLGRYIVRIFSTIGEYTFEILLFHASISDYFFFIYPLRITNYRLFFFYILCGTIVGSIALRKISLLVETKFSRLINWLEKIFTAV